MASHHTRRDVLRKAGLAGSLIRIPAVAGVFADGADACSAVCEPDRIFAALADWRALSDHFWSLDDVPDAEMNAACAAESTAALHVLTTVPRTLPGLGAFCELGDSMSRAEHGRDDGLMNWSPGYALGGNHDDAETLFMNTLAEAARRLLPV